MEHIYKKYKISYTPPYFIDSTKKRILCFASEHMRQSIQECYYVKFVEKSL